MINNTSYSLEITEHNSVTDLSYGVWLVVLHAFRKPPHVGLLINGKYSSLTLKGIEKEIDSSILLKSIQQKKIESVFVQLKKHPVFSTDYLNEILKLNLNKFEKVKPFEASCVSPVKLFLNEFYALNSSENELLYELVERLKQNNFIDSVYGVNLKNTVTFNFPIYSFEELQQFISNEIQPLNLK